MTDNDKVTYSVESIVCDSAVYSSYKDEKSLICICNSRANALMIRDILTADHDHKIYEPFESSDACLGELMGALDAMYHPRGLISEITPYGMCIEIRGIGRLSEPNQGESDILRQISHKSGDGRLHLIRKVGFFTLWDNYLV